MRRNNFSFMNDCIAVIYFMRNLAESIYILQTRIYRTCLTVLRIVDWIFNVMYPGEKYQITH